MKPRESIVRLKLFQVREKNRQIAQLDMMMTEFRRMADELGLQIAAEEKKAGITDLHHFAYPTFARAARQRRDNLLNSLNDLHIQKSRAEEALLVAQEELKQAEALELRDGRVPDSSEMVFVQSRAMIG